MIQIKIHSVTIHKDKVTKPSKEIWAWELPILEEKFPGGLVAVNEDLVVERESLPDAAEEFSRLGTLYGTEQETGQAYIHLAYGRGKAGITALGKAIKASTVKPKPKPRAKPKAKPPASEPKDPLA